MMMMMMMMIPTKCSGPQCRNLSVMWPGCSDILVIGLVHHAGLVGGCKSQLP
jgi:hypothetical protein